MKALHYIGPQEMVYSDISDTTVGVQEEVIVAIDASGICGSDLHVYRGHHPERSVPAILGHEAAGHILSGPQTGQPVVINPLIACGSCKLCDSRRSNLCQQRVAIGWHRPGTFAEQVMVPKDNLIPMPQDMNPAHAALTEPAATAIHATRLAERALFGSIESTAVLVIGAGSIGLLSALALQAQGVEQITITEANAMRCTSAARTGDWKIIDGAKTAPPPGAYDLIIDAVGSHTSRHIALSAVGVGGVVIHIGLADNDGAIDVHRMTRHEITLMGAYTYTAQDLEDALHQLHRGSLGDLSWIETRQLHDGPNAFRDLDAGRIAAGKIILMP